MKTKDYYRILGINRTATIKEIKRAYYQLARRYHPDVNRDDRTAESTFKQINEAYEVVSDPQKREDYDRICKQQHWFDRYARTRDCNAKESADHRHSRSSDNFNLSDTQELFDSLFCKFHTKHRETRRSRRPIHGKDVEYPIEITLEESYKGSSRIIDFETAKECPRCKGRGLIRGKTCIDCNASGTKTQSRRLQVTIPIGARNGLKICLAGEGHSGANGGDNGNIYLVVQLKPHEYSRLKGDDLYVELSVPLTVLALGGEVQITALQGTFNLDIPAGTQDGQIIRVAGKGMPRIGDHVRGDLIVTIRVMLPTSLTHRERALFEQLRALETGKVDQFQ